MKKLAITLSLLGVVLSAGAQTMYDALKFSENNYFGTARTLAMGNAFTALGGDLGSININPAGSAVAGYSQFTLTPSISLSASSSQGTVLSGESLPFCFENNIKSNSTKFLMPNIGVTLDFDTHRTSGIKNITVGFIANVTNDFNGSILAKGTNSNTSYAGAMAAGAIGLDNSIFSGNDPYGDPGIPWSTILAWDAHIIDPLDTKPDEYVGTTENWYLDNGIYNTALGAPLEQTYGRISSGSKYDYVLNVGANISDFIYIGANLGITSLAYSSDDYIREVSTDSDMFQTGFESLKVQNKYNATGTGVYGKFGILATPFGGLRIGAAIQTPTALYMNERWQSAAQTYFANAQNNSSAQTPEGEYSYRLTSPFRFNVGAAYTFGQYGVISADYEMTDYKGMRFSARGTNDNSAFDFVNDQIKGYITDPWTSFMGISHQLRVGAEVKPLPEFAVRAGYGLTTSPERFYDDMGNTENVNANSHRFSFGLGYSSKGSFFADLACSALKYSNEYIRPYSDYIFDDKGNVAILSPEINARKILWNIAMTIGFRF